NQQFELVSQREELPPVDPALIASLERLVSCADLNEAVAAESAPEAASIVEPAPVVVPVLVPVDGAQAEAATGDITDEEFEKLLDAISGPNNASTPAATSAPAVANNGSDEISEDEFEALLDQLHGKGKGPGESAAANTASAAS